MNEAEMPAWAKDMRDCRLATLKIMQGIKDAIDTGKTEQLDTILGEEETIADGLIKLGTFLLRWHTFERGLEDAAFLGDAENDRPLGQDDLVVLREYLRNAQNA